MSTRKPNSPNSPNFSPIVRYAGAQAHEINNSESLGLSGLPHSKPENAAEFGTLVFLDLRPGDYVTVWRPLGSRDVPPVISLRHLLKRPLREGFEALGGVHKFRCVEVRQIESTSANEQQTPARGQIDECLRDLEGRQSPGPVLPVLGSKSRQSGNSTGQNVERGAAAGFENNPSRCRSAAAVARQVSGVRKRQPACQSAGAAGGAPSEDAASRSLPPERGAR